MPPSPYISVSSSYRSSFDGEFYAEHHTCTEQVFALYHHIGLHLPVESPTASQHIVVLIAEVRSAEEVVRVTSCRRSDAQVAVVVAPTCHTGFVGDAETVTSVVLPKTFGTHMTARLAVRPLDVTVSTGIDSAAADEAAAKADGFYTLDGTKVNASQMRHGIYVVRQNGKSRKVVR